MIYKIDKGLQTIENIASLQSDECFVASISKKEWDKNKKTYGFAPETEIDFLEGHVTKAISNGESYTGTFSIPDRENIMAEDRFFWVCSK